MENLVCATIAQALEREIQKGNFTPGDRLPAERPLAAQYQVSRNTVREAIKTLVEKGVVETRVGAGSYVAQTPGKALGQALAQNRKRLRDILEIRILLEPQMARLAAQRISPPLLDQLKSLVAEQEKAISKGKTGAAQDMAFHRCLALAGDNQVLLELYDTLSEILAESRAGDLQSPRRLKASVETHRSLIQALEARDPDTAARAMESHMARVKQLLNI